MEEGEHDHPAGGGGMELERVDLRGDADETIGTRQARRGGGKSSHGVRGVKPAPVTGYADRLNVIACGVNSREDVPGRYARDLVLGRPTPEQHDEAGFRHVEEPRCRV